ncbi:hypothetical protein CHS0354_035437 [Potamilus streckersoni]|uniref:Uncharacterized protein n=1 Tax=Potamilus streckersoni TaxID=2493646 RepID=A0AAE0TDK2_9BIVA|nr:hypothetical protein CHS0354_035437 [Potamilus streckersoni]
MDKEEAKFRQIFQSFPSLFNLEIKEMKNSKKIELYKKKVMEKVLSDEFESTTERVRIYNLVSFLHWSVNDEDVANMYSRMALELDKENIVSLSNRIWMKREEGHLTEANEELKKLAKLVDSEHDLLILGNAEIAYSYSVFGPSYLLKSKDMLEEVVRDMGEKDIDPITLTLSKLDLGIIYRKLCNFGNMPRQGWEKRNEEGCIKRGAQLLYEVARSNSSPRWRSRSWASLAELLHGTSKGVRFTKYRIEVLFPKEVKDTGVECLLDLAMETCDKDSHVLKICGKLYRYLKKLDKAEIALRKSLTIRKTSYAHHHLALVLKQILKDKLFANRHHHNENSDRYDPISTCIRHKTFLPNVTQGSKESNCPSRYSPRRHDHNKQAFSQTETRTTVVRNKKFVSTTSKKEKRVKSSTIETDSTLQHTSNKLSTRAIAKGLDRVFSIPDDEEKNVQEILYHLDEAIHFGNGWASLEKGIVLRQIKKFDEALFTFLMTLKMEDSITAILEVSCYENLGACCRDIAEKEADLELRRKREIDAVIYWRKALDKIASKEGKTLHFLKEEWMSYPTLKDMFQHQQLDAEMLKALAELGEILERPAETRSFFQEILKLGGNEANDPTIISGEIKTLLMENRYEDAAQMLEKSETEGIEINRNFRKMVYLECAFYLVNIGKTENASERFRQAFDINSLTKSDFDIFLIYDDNEDAEIDKPMFDLAEKLEDFFSGNCGLRITSNSKNVDPRKQRWAEQTRQMECSEHIILLLDTNKEPRGDLEYFIGIVQGISKNNTSILTIILVDECTCPPELAIFSTMHFEIFFLENNITDFDKDIFPKIF